MSTSALTLAQVGVEYESGRQGTVDWGAETTAGEGKQTVEP